MIKYVPNSNQHGYEHQATCNKARSEHITLVICDLRQATKTEIKYLHVANITGITI